MVSVVGKRNVKGVQEKDKFLEKKNKTCNKWEYRKKGKEQPSRA